MNPSEGCLSSGDAAYDIYCVHPMVVEKGGSRSSQLV
jgi:hypothetical protein